MDNALFLHLCIGNLEIVKFQWPDHLYYSSPYCETPLPVHLMSNSLIVLWIVRKSVL